MVIQKFGSEDLWCYIGSEVQEGDKMATYSYTVLIKHIPEMLINNKSKIEKIKQLLSNDEIEIQDPCACFIQEVSENNLSDSIIITKYFDTFDIVMILTEESNVELLKTFKLI